MKFCGKCGAPCDDAYKHCPECGSPLSDNETIKNNSSASEDPSTAGESNSKFDNPFMTAYTAPEDASTNIDSPEAQHDEETTDAQNNNIANEKEGAQEADKPKSEKIEEASTNASTEHCSFQSDEQLGENTKETSSTVDTENANSHSDNQTSENTYTYSYSDNSAQTDNTNENTYNYTHSANEKETTFDNNGYTNNYNTGNNYTGNNAYSTNNAYGNAGYNNNFQPNSIITPRNIPLCVILSIVTCGIYGIYWMIKLNDEINALAGEPYATSGGMVFLLSVVTCNIYNLYWMYKMGERTDRINGIQGNSNILYLVIGIFGFGIVNYCLMQDAINKRMRGM